MNFLDVFAGIGGFSLGLERAGMKCVGQVEIEPFCLSVLEHHWPQVWRGKDVRDVAPDDVVRRCGRIDLLCGGFPCQDLSVAGKGKGLSGERSGLWWEMHRLIRGLRPDWLLIENVPALRTRGADDVLGALESEGYTCWPTVVGAWAVGAPHRRDRVWIVGYSQGLRRGQGGEPTREATRGSASSGSMVGYSTGERLAQHQGQRSDDGQGRKTVTRTSWPAGAGEPQHAWESTRLIESSVGAATDGLSRLLVWTKSRLRKYRLRATGNAVVPQVVECFGRAIMSIANA